MNSLRIPLKHLAIIALLAAVAVLPMVFRGMPGGNDAVQHYEFAQHVVDAFRSGDLFPHFAGNANHGFGDVGLRVYPPLSYYAFAFGYFVFGEWYTASIAVLFLIFFVGALGVFLWTKEFFDINSSLAAAAVFTFAPFHLNEIYNNFLFAEFAAGSLLPFCFLFVTRTVRTGGVANILLLAVAYAILICTHLPLTIIGSISLAIYSITTIGFRNVSRYAALAISVVVSLVLSSFYWVRMISEMDWVKHSRPEYFSEIWSYDENFLLSVRTFTDFMNDGQSLWFGDLMLVATVLIAIPALIGLRQSEQWREFGKGPLSLFAVGLFFATPVSMLVWKLFPLLQKVQFPWRWLNIVSLAASVVAGAGLVSIARRLKESNNTKLSLVVAISVLPFVFVSAFVVRAPHFTPRVEFNAKSSAFSTGETFAGWWPAWASKQFAQRDAVVAFGRQVTVDEWLPTRRSFSVEAGTATEAIIATFYYPHWKATINGRAEFISPTQTGTISMQIPEENSRVELRFVEPPMVAAAAWLSLTAWLTSLLALAIILFRRSNKNGTLS